MVSGTDSRWTLYLVATSLESSLTKYTRANFILAYLLFYAHVSTLDFHVS